MISNLSSVYNWTKIHPTIEVDYQKVISVNQTISTEMGKTKGVETIIIENPINLSNFEFPLQCKVLDWDHFNITEPPIEIRILFDQTENVTIRLYVEEKNKSLWKRHMDKNLLSYNGPDIENENLSNGKIMNYMFSISQEINSELDKDKYCKNYPTKEYSSFRDCDEKNLYEKFLKSNLMPIWAAKLINETTIYR